MTVLGSSEEIATEQVATAEKQRVLGIVPNFYVVYDPHPAPLTTRLKFSLALKAQTDPVVFVGAALVAGIEQAGDTPNYGQGAKGYSQRLGANLRNGIHRHHGRRRPSALSAAPGSTLLLPGHRHHTVAHLPRALQPVYLQGRQWNLAAELLERGWRSGGFRHFKHVLPGLESRNWSRVSEFPNYHQRTHGK